MKETFTPYNIAIVGVAAVGPLFGGYTLAVVGPTLGQPTFYESLNLVADPTAPGYGHTGDFIGIANGIFFAAGFLGTFVAGACGDYFGRVGSLRIAAAIGIIGGTIQTAAVNQAMYLVARVVTGLAAGHTIAALPTYFAEVAPPHSRGMMGGAQGLAIAAGYCLAGWIGLGCYFSTTSSFGWRFPNAIVILLAILLLLGTLMIPESPRWLMKRDNLAQASAILRRLHHDPTDPDDEFTHREMELIRKQITSDNLAWEADGRWQLFTIPTYRRRLVLAFLLLMGGQNVGILVINNYNVLLYKSLGLDSVSSLAVSAAWVTVPIPFMFLGAYVSDKIGRRWALVGGFAANVACFIVATGLIGQYNSTPTRSYAVAATFFLFLYNVFYGSLIDINQWTAATEIFPSHLRAQASGISISAVFLTDVLWLELQPTASATIGWKYYLVFLCLGIIHTIHLYFYLPNTAGLALEEIDEIFGKPAAARLLDNDLIDETGAGSDKAAVTLEHEHAMQTGHTEKHMIES